MAKSTLAATFYIVYLNAQVYDKGYKSKSSEFVAIKNLYTIQLFHALYCDFVKLQHTYKKR